MIIRLIVQSERIPVCWVIQALRTALHSTALLRFCLSVCECWSRNRNWSVNVPWQQRPTFNRLEGMLATISKSQSLPGWPQSLPQISAGLVSSITGDRCTVNLLIQILNSCPAVRVIYTLGDTILDASRISGSQAVDCRATLRLKCLPWEICNSLETIQPDIVAWYLTQVGFGIRFICFNQHVISSLLHYET